VLGVLALLAVLGVLGVLGVREGVRFKPWIYDSRSRTFTFTNHRPNRINELSPILKER
jgi:hypothetical protein